MTPITVKTNHIKPVPRMPELSEKSTAMFKHAILSIVTCQALRAYNNIYQGDSLRIQVGDSNDESINHRYGLMIGSDEGG